MIAPDNEVISVIRQCELLGIHRSGCYYEPQSESTLNLEIMRKLDEQYTDYPFYGVQRMYHYILSLGYPVNIKRIRRLLRLMGLYAIYPKPKTSIADKAHKTYPYLLKGLLIERSNQVWSTDITYIPMEKGFLYLVAIIDWYSRYVLSWQICNTLETGFCIEALQVALKKGKPEIFNTDQGSQYTSKDFLNPLKDNGIKISMDSKGRAFDNIFNERLWRTVKYEEVYLNAYQTARDAFKALKQYFLFYNNKRLHQSLGYLTPAEVHFQ